MRFLQSRDKCLIKYLFILKFNVSVNYLKDFDLKSVGEDCVLNSFQKTIISLNVPNYDRLKTETYETRRKKCFSNPL